MYKCISLKSLNHFSFFPQSLILPGSRPLAIYITALFGIRCDRDLFENLKKNSPEKKLLSSDGFFEGISMYMIAPSKLLLFIYFLAVKKVPATTTNSLPIPLLKHLYLLSLLDLWLSLRATSSNFLPYL